MSGMTQVSRNNVQRPSVPREDFENADAAAKLVHPGTRKPLGRQAPRECRDTLTTVRVSLGISEEAGVSIRKIAQQTMNEARRRRCMYCQPGQMERAVERCGRFGKTVSKNDTGSEIIN